MATTKNGIYYPGDYNAKADIPTDLKKMAESIDKNVQDNKYNDEPIKQDIQELQTDVSDIKSEQETQNDLLQRTQSALINITTPKSSNISVKDSSDLGAKVDVYGISEQETRSGKNKANSSAYNYDTVSYQDLDVNLENNEFTISTDSLRIITEYVKVPIKITENGTYTFGLELKANTSGATAQALIYDSTNKKTVGSILQNNTTTYAKKTTTTTIDDTVDKNNINVLLYCNGTVGNAYSYSYKNIFVNPGQDDEFEQYGASPSPKYPSKIENVTGNIDITVCNKNIFNCLKWLKMNHSAGYPVAITDNTNTAIEIIKETKNSIKYNQKSAYYGVLSEYIPVKKGQIFTLSFNYININRLFVTQYDKDKTRIKELNNAGNVNTTTFTVEQDGFITIAFSYSNATPNENTIEITNIQLEVGTVKTDYIENEQQTITFPLQEGQKLYKGDYLADDGIHHVRKQKLITGEEALWTYYSANDIWARPYVQIDDKKIGESNNTANALCNKAKSISWEDMTAGLNEYAVFTYEGDNRISIAIKKEDLETQDVEGVKKYFQKNNMIVEYNLAKEEVEPYTPEQQEAYNKLQNVLSYYNVTNVFTDKAQLVFKYIADTQTWTVNLVKSEIANTNQQLLNLAGGN